MSNRANVLLLAILTASSLILASVTSVLAQSSTLSIPSFTAKYIDKSYDVPESTSIDPYTGKTVTNPSYHVENKVIELNIKDQNTVAPRYFEILVKGHFEDMWHGIFMHEHSPTSTNVTLHCSKSQNTDEGEVYAPPGGQIDFKIAAFTGGETRDFSSPLPFLFFNVTRRSDWSNIQTLTIPVSSTPGTTSSSSSIPVTNTVFGETPQTFQLAVAIGAVIAISVCVGLLVYVKKRKR